MALHLRRRGAIWHARGTVRVGRETIRVSGFSTGCRSRADAEAVVAREEARLREEHLAGPSGRARRRSIADALLAWLTRPGGVASYDRDRASALNEAIGHRPLSEAPAAWRDWLATRGRALAPATARRWRSVLMAALRHHAALEGLPRPELAPVPVGARERQRVVTLPAPLREALLAAYHPAAAGPALLLAYAGLRTQEALRLDWREVDLARKRIIVAARKTRHGRVVPMHPRVAEALAARWEAAGRPAQGPVFLSSRGRPYADTTGRGGNPLKRAHATACRRVGLTGFRVHDWRHDFAVRFLAEGSGDVRALMQVMGWSSIRMAERYVVHRDEHLAAAVSRLR